MLKHWDENIKVDELSEYEEIETIKEDIQKIKIIINDIIKYINGH